MNKICCLLFAGLTLSLAGCSTPVALAPVGPDPYRSAGTGPEGKLEVYSRLSTQTEGNNPVWYQHSDYRVYNFQGQLVKYVGNSIGRYEQAPLPLALPSGRYLVKARSRDYMRVMVPVIIESGRTTRIYLDGSWQPPADTARTALVTLPNGVPVGWRAFSQEKYSGSTGL
jgi:hypothetical protein